MRHLIPAIAITALCAPTAWATKTTPVETSVGRAYDLESGEFLYSEHHHETWENGQLRRCDVEYRYPSGVIFATKTLEFPERDSTPAFEMIDRRDGYREGADVSGGEVELYGSAETAPEMHNIDLPPNAVIDAGFNRFVQGRLAELRRGDNVKFRFAVPSQGRFIGFRLAPEERSSSAGSMELVMEPSNPLLRLLVDPVRLTYDADGRLREFRGLSNIRDESGDLHEARIVFRYGDESSAGRSET